MRTLIHTIIAIACSLLCISASQAGDGRSEIIRWYSHTLKKTVVFFISNNEADECPKWSPTDLKSPPVSPGEAEKLVKERFRGDDSSALPKASAEKYELCKIHIKGKAVWIWILSYATPGQPVMGWSGAPGFVRVPVLLSGKVADIKLSGK